MNRFAKTVWVLFVLTLFINLTVTGQETGVFSGTVFAGDTGEKLIGAHIKLKGDPSVGSITNVEGQFNFEVDTGKQVFIFSFTGMQTDTVAVQIEPGETFETDVYLEPYVSDLQGVEIRVGKFDRKLEDLTVTMEVIKPDLIENKNTTNIKSILDYTPGLNILDNEPQIRGGSGFTFGVGSKVGIFIDDMPVLSADAGMPYWDLIPVENIEQIEVVKGCASVLSGSNALSGAIYIRTATPSLQPKTKISIYTGGYTAPKNDYMKWWDDYPYLGGVSFLHSRATDRLDIVVGGNFDFDHGYIGAPRPGPFVTDTLSDFTDEQMATRRGRINFNLRKRSQQIKGLNYGVNGNVMLQSTNMTLAWLDDSTGFYRGYPGAVVLQDQFIFYLDPFVNFYSNLGIKHSLKARILRNSVQSSNNQDNLSTVYYADYNFKREYDFLKNFAFIGGITFQFNDVKAALYSGGGSDHNTLMNVSGYTEIESNIFQIINLSLGARLEYFSLNDTATDLKPIFRAGASLKLMQETYLRGSIGQGYRYPTIAERYILTNMGSFAVFNNPDLVPESSWNAEVGVKQGFKFANFFGYLDAAVFTQQYSNTIEYLFGFWDSTYTFALAGFRFLNTGRSEINGIDLSLNTVGRLTNDLKLKTILGYTYIMPVTLDPDYVFAKDYNPGGSSEFSYNSTSLDPSGNILKYRFRHTVKGDVEISYKKFSAGISLKYFSRIENLDKAIKDFEDATKASGGSLQPIEYMDYFRNHNDGNWIFDGRASYHFMEKHKISVISNNLFNRWYSLRPLKAEPMRSIMVQYLFEL